MVSKFVICVYHFNKGSFCVIYCKALLRITIIKHRGFSFPFWKNSATWSFLITCFEQILGHVCFWLCMKICCIISDFKAFDVAWRRNMIEVGYGVFIATFNNISAISRRSVVLVTDKHDQIMLYEYTSPRLKWMGMTWPSFWNNGSISFCESRIMVCKICWLTLGINKLHDYYFNSTKRIIYDV
jgi:hypothetical protein